MSELPNKEMKLTSVERIERSQLISGVRRTNPRSGRHRRPSQRYAARLGAEEHTMRSTVLRAVAFIAASAVFVSVAPSDDSLVRLLSARQEAQANVATPEGEAWQQKNVRAFGPALKPLFTKCAPLGDASAHKPEVILFLRLSKEGRVREVVTEATGPFAACVTTGLSATRLPSAPRDNYWIQLRMAP